MAKAKYVDARIQHKYDTQSNWSSATFTPLAGELIIFAADGTSGSATTSAYPRFKVGDGKTAIGNLPLLDFVGDLNAKQGELGYIKNKGSLATKNSVSKSDLSFTLGKLADKDKVDTDDCNFAIGGSLASKNEVAYADLTSDLKQRIDNASGGTPDTVNNAGNVLHSIGSLKFDQIFVDVENGLLTSGKVHAAANADVAGTANHAITAGSADYALTANTADRANSADNAINATYAGEATSAGSANRAHALNLNGSDVSVASILYDGTGVVKKASVADLSNNTLQFAGFSDSQILCRDEVYNVYLPKVQSAQNADSANVAMYYNSGGSPSGVPISEAIGDLWIAINNLADKIKSLE